MQNIDSVSSLPSTPEPPRKLISPEGFRVAGLIARQGTGAAYVDYALNRRLPDSLSASEYQQFCAEYMPGGISDSAVSAKIGSLNQYSDQDLAVNFPVGSTIILAFIPVTEQGNRLSATDISNNVAIRELIFNSQTGFTSGFGFRNSTLASLLPSEIRKLCSFTVEAGDTRDSIKSKYTSAILNLQKAINQLSSN